MNGSSYGSPNSSALDSSSSDGESGRNHSRSFTFWFNVSRMSARRGSATKLRAPNARGPNSMRPWNQPTTPPSEISWATRGSSSASGSVSNASPASDSAAAHSAEENDGPK